MNPRHLELARELCELAGAPNLIEYLGLPSYASADVAREELKKRRKYMQGMQSNPKYKAEALFLIKHFASIDNVLEDPSGYLAAVSRQQESAHLPILEMTIRGVLKGGNLNEEQEDYLRRNALELGLSAQTFEETLDRLVREAGIHPRAMRRSADEITDHYGVLGVPDHATRDDIYEAYRNRYREARNLKNKAESELMFQKIDRAWQVLSDPSSRDAYDLSRRNTGPPAKDRETLDEPGSTNAAPTAPPVRPRVSRPPPVPEAAVVHGTAPVGGLRNRPRLEILGDPIRRVVLGKNPVAHEILVRNAGDDLMPGRISTDEPWLIAQPTRLDPGKKNQSITVRINPRDLPGSTATGVVTVQTDRGDRASIVFEARRAPSVMPLLLALAGVCALVAIVLVSLSTWRLIDPGPGTGLTITVDPTSDDILLDGISVGSGSSVFVADPPTGDVTITVLQKNFSTHVEEIAIPSGEPVVHHVVLELTAPMTFKPAEGDQPGKPGDAIDVQKVMAPRTLAMDACVAPVVPDGQTYTGYVRTHVGPDGAAIGVDIAGQGTDDPRVYECLKRQAAALHVSPITGGTFSTIRYEYTVPEPPR